MFHSDEAIGALGVGKNMVSAIRHWALHSGIVAENKDSGTVGPTVLGTMLFHEETGLDPYLEHPATLWLIHWNLCSGEYGRTVKTTWYWLFNHHNQPFFRRDELLQDLLRLAETRGWPRVSRTTVQRDVDCLVRTYDAASTARKVSVEELVESPLAELGLMRSVAGVVHLGRGSKPTLPTSLFAFALSAFWEQYADSATLSYEAIAHEAGSPGRVFLLDEGDLTERLLGLADATGGRMRWTESAGVRQVVRTAALGNQDRHEFLRQSYPNPVRGRVSR
jgi:hypothetical protein